MYSSSSLCMSSQTISSCPVLAIYSILSFHRRRQIVGVDFRPHKQMENLVREHGTE
ncbi:hypothetical protein HYC85_029946 [Camellia sinensis]|uniref:Uncharacterized protein n=1 Tax=Camellia sinensis TaxID=4442 RepID=A0A7J7G052_CAMSI|nr:hypothetical protein HYC85_029946 [Camellia sinensis]